MPVIIIKKGDTYYLYEDESLLDVSTLSEVDAGSLMYNAKTAQMEPLDAGAIAFKDTLEDGGQHG